MLTALTRIDRYECFAASKEAPDRGAEPGLPVPFGGNLDGEGKPITNIASTPAVPSEQHPVKALVSQCHYSLGEEPTVGRGVMGA